MKTLIIVPAYNEQENIRSTVGDLRRHCPEADVLVINDCSTDGTPQILREDGIAHLSLPVNLGIGGGVQTGYMYARDNGYDIAIQFDGDGQHEARFLPEMIAPVGRGEADLVIGSRFLKKEGFQSTGLRRAGIRWLSGLIRLLTGVRVLDVTSGMRAVGRTYIEAYAGNYAQDYPEPEAILYAAARKARILEIPVEMRERSGGKSTISPLRSVYYMIKVSLALIIGRISTGGNKE